MKIKVMARSCRFQGKSLTAIYDMENFPGIVFLVETSAFSRAQMEETFTWDAETVNCIVTGGLVYRHKEVVGREDEIEFFPERHDAPAT